MSDPSPHSKRRKVPHSLTHQHRHIAGEIDNGGGFKTAITAIDNHIHTFFQHGADIVGVVEGQLITGPVPPGMLPVSPSSRADPG